MITTIEQLYDHVNRFQTPARLGEVDGYLRGGGIHFVGPIWYSA